MEPDGTGVDGTHDLRDRHVLHVDTDYAVASAAEKVLG